MACTRDNGHWLLWTGNGHDQFQGRPFAREPGGYREGRSELELAV